MQIPARRSAWTADELKQAFYFYCQTSFGKLHSRNPVIIRLAKLLGRTPSALAMKLVNFASLDPSITATGRKGLSGASKLDRAIWDEFHADWERLTVESEQLTRQLLQHNKQAELMPSKSADELSAADFSGETRQAITQKRLKQNFFRNAVLSSYRDRCCISGVSERRLLVASHIVPWSIDKSNRLNPSNGLCLSAIHDKAFDSYLFSLSDDWRVVLSPTLKATRDGFLRKIFWPIDEKPIELPERFAPDVALVERHRQIMMRAIG
jgi:putative restriction endonuclease